MASGLSISGSLATFGDDSLVAQYATGKGIGRYFNDSVSSTGFAVGADDGSTLVRSSGAHLVLPAPLGAGLDDRRRRQHAVGKQRRRAFTRCASPPYLRRQPT